MALQKLFLGTTTGDKTGTGAKSAGQMINANFDYLEAKIDNVDKLVSETGFSLVGQELWMNAGWEWLINGISYSNPVLVKIPIPFAATGKERIDLIVLNTSNTFTRIPGTESVSNPAAEPVPNDTVQATLVVVTDGVIEQPTAPVTGDAYVGKNEFTFTKLSGSGAKAQFTLSSEVTNVRVISASSIGSVSVDKKYIYPGKDHYVKNETGTTLIIKHNSGTGNYKYLFPNTTDLVIQNNEIVHFKFRFDTGNNGFLDYVGLAGGVTDISGKVDKVTGKSLLLDTEITRLATLSNFDDSSIQAELDTKLNTADYNEHFKGVYLTESALNTARPTANVGDYAQVNVVGSTDILNYNWDAEENIWVKNATQSTPISNTDELPEGTSNLYFTVVRFLANLTFANIISALGFTPANDSSVLHKTGNETITGSKTFNSNAPGTGIYSINTSTSTGINSSNSSTGIGIYSANNSTGIGAQFNNYSSGLNLVLNNDTSATGIPFSIQKAYVSKLTINDNGEVVGNKYIKTGGTSSQFLKADGSVDSTTYQSVITNPITGTGTTNYIPKWTGAGTQGNSLVQDDGTDVMISKIGSTSLNIQTNINGSPSLFLTAGGSDGMSMVYDRATSEIRFSNSGASNAFKISNAGASTFSSSVTATAFNKPDGTPYVGILPVTETGTSFSLTDAYNGKVVILTASCTVTIPDGLVAGFEVSIVTLAGVTLTIAQGASVVLFNNAGTTMAEKLSMTLKNRTATNQYITTGNI